MIGLLLLTLAVAAGSAMILFRIYHTLLHLCIAKMGWNMEDLKRYEVSPSMKTWDQIIQGVIMLGIIWKVMN